MKLLAQTRKVVACPIVALLMLGILGMALAVDYYSESYYWNFQNYSYFSFNQMVNFSDSPYQGVPHESSLVGYWRFDESMDLIAQDSSGNANNGIISGATKVVGKYGTALSFDRISNSYVEIADSSVLNIKTAITVSAWINCRDVNSSSRILSKSQDLDKMQYDLYIFNSLLHFRVRINSTWITATKSISQGVWAHVVGIYDGSNVYAFVNNVPGTPVFTSGSIATSDAPLRIGIRKLTNGGFDSKLNGVIDEVRIYGRALPNEEVSMLYSTSPYMQPDSVSFASHYNFTDFITKNAMLVHVDNPNKNGENTVVVTCTNFFVGNRLVFQANNSAIVNVWTNLGPPTYTTGVWNSQNYTTTLTLDSSSMGEIGWTTYFNITTYTDAHCSVSPSNVTVALGSSQTFYFSATQGYSFNVLVDGVSKGQIGNYTFHNVTAPHMVNVTSTKLTYQIAAFVDKHSSITPGNVTLSYGENQLFNITASSGYRISHVFVDGKDMGSISSYYFEKVRNNHTISVFSMTLNRPLSTDIARANPQNPIQAEVVAIILVITAIVAALIFAFKKSYITVELVEENPSE